MAVTKHGPRGPAGWAARTLGWFHPWPFTLSYNGTSIMSWTGDPQRAVRFWRRGKRHGVEGGSATPRLAYGQPSNLRPFGAEPRVDAWCRVYAYPACIVLKCAITGQDSPWTTPWGSRYSHITIQPRKGGGFVVAWWVPVEAVPSGGTGGIPPRGHAVVHKWLEGDSLDGSDVLDTILSAVFGNSWDPRDVLRMKDIRWLRAQPGIVPALAKQYHPEVAVGVAAAYVLLAYMNRGSFKGQDLLIGGVTGLALNAYLADWFAAPGVGIEDEPLHTL